MEHIEYKDRKQIYIQAINHYGVDGQLVKAIEELNECGQQLCKVLLGQGDRRNLAEEVADATIMLEQIRVALDINDDVHKQMDYKLLRLQDKIRKEQAPAEPIRCGNCDYVRDMDMRCMCRDSQWAGILVKPDNYCQHGIPREE